MGNIPHYSLLLRRIIVKYLAAIAGVFRYMAKGNLLTIQHYSNWIIFLMLLQDNADKGHIYCSGTEQ